jgi:hypothetical protein
MWLAVLVEIQPFPFILLVAVAVDQLLQALRLLVVLAVLELTLMVGLVV